MAVLNSPTAAVDESRSRERYRRVGLTTLLSVASRGAALAVMFLSLRIALPYMGEARYGVWMTITSLATVPMLFDFGIGNGMISRVAALSARSDTTDLGRFIGFGLWVLSAIGLAVGGLLVCAAAYGPVNWLYRDASPALVHEARQALVMFAVLLGLSVPLQSAHRIYAGLQEGYFSMGVAGLMSLLSLALVPFLPAMHAGVVGFLLATYGLQLASGLLLIVVLCRRFKLAMPGGAEFRIADVRALMGSGGLFLVLQVAGVIGWEMDPVLISALVGPAAVATYSVVQQMFLLVSGPLAMLNASLWGGYAEAYARRDISYLKTTLHYSVLGTVGLASLGATVVLAVYAPLAHLLTKGTLHPPGSLVGIFAAWTVLSAAGGAFAIYLNGLHVVAPQVIVCVAFVLLAIVLKLALIHPYGLEGVVLGTLLSYLLTVALPYATVFNRAVSAQLRME